MNEKTLLEISKKLDVLISLTLRLLIDDNEFGKRERGKQGVGELARYLSDLGLDAKDISRILGAPLPSIRTLLTPHRRK